MSAAASSIRSTKPVRNMIVAIDGPAGAGKSTLARHLARHFGLLNLETGAMYRAFALKALRAAIPLDDCRALEVLTAETTIRLEPGDEENRVLLDGEDVTGFLRNPSVTDAASRVSVFPAIRAWMVGLQQKLGAQGGIVMEGRDIGTVVFPHAPVKIFLDAAPEVRGQRRFEQLGQLGQLGQSGIAPVIQPDPGAQSEPGAPGEISSPLKREEIIRELRARDERDRNRADSPLRPAPDAVLLDSTGMTLDEAVRAAIAIVTARLASSSMQS
jgi:CMP/dCMP kinase